MRLEAEPVVPLEVVVGAARVAAGKNAEHLPLVAQSLLLDIMEVRGYGFVAVGERGHVRADLLRRLLRDV